MKSFRNQPKPCQNLRKPKGNQLEINGIPCQILKTSFEDRLNALPNPLKFYWKSIKSLPNP